jgi:glutamate formiminotransferase/formiminotetrahydrofolate cyclodeaminase
MKLIECVPNFSEGRRPEVIDAIRAAIAAVEGAVVLDLSSDASHNRTVITFVAPPEAVVGAALAGAREAARRIDLREHSGEHPRMGATDVVPFVPLEGTTIEECVALARDFGQRVGHELDIPVFLYERAATRPERRNLADVRRGEFEGLRDRIGPDASADPDFGPRRIHPTAGAMAVGARPFLVAFNVYLGPAAHMDIAKRVARAVRASTGGLAGVKALALEVDGQAQVSMNLVDLDATPMHRAYDMVKMEAEAAGVQPTWSEIVGLVPERAVVGAAARHLRLDKFGDDQVLERRVRQAMAGGESVSGFLAAVAAPTPTPGGGSVAAHVGAVAASLARMVAGLTIGKKKYAAVEEEMRGIAERAGRLASELSALVARDAASYAAVSEAYKLPKEPAEAAAARTRAIDEALLGAARVPLETAERCAAAAELAADAAARGNANARSDAVVAALVADAGCRGAALNVRVNVAAMSDKSAGESLARSAAALVERSRAAAVRAEAAVEG